MNLLSMQWNLPSEIALLSIAKISVPRINRTSADTCIIVTPRWNSGTSHNNMAPIAAAHGTAQSGRGKRSRHTWRKNSYTTQCDDKLTISGYYYVHAFFR